MNMLRGVHEYMLAQRSAKCCTEIAAVALIIEEYWCLLL